MTKVNLNNVFDKKDAWEKVACPICNKKATVHHELDINLWEIPGTYSICKCKDCDIYLQNPRVKSKYVSIYYKDEVYWGSDLDRMGKDVSYKNNRSEKYDYIFKNINPDIKGSVLDVGCGTGLLLSSFKKRGWEVKGIDTSKNIVNYANRTFNVNAHVADLKSFKSGNKRYDLVTMTHVLEHVYEPLKDLKKIQKLLKKDGSLVLVIPNINSLGYKLYKENWSHFHPGRHLYYYSPATIKKLLNKSGFSDINITHIGKEDNYYSQFQSLRYKFSPKFNIKDNNNNMDPQKPLEHSSSYEVKKYLSRIVAETLTYFSALIGQSDVITVYAKKR